MSKYKLRKVIKQYVGNGVALKDVQIRYELLECGHSIRYRDPQSVAEKIRWSVNLVRRCKQCAAEQKMHPTLGESAASDSESNPAPKRVI